MEEETIMLDEPNQKSNVKKDKVDISPNMMKSMLVLMALTIVGLTATVVILLGNYIFLLTRILKQSFSSLFL